MDLEARALELIPGIYAAATDPERWPEFLEGLSDACGGAAVALTLVTPVPESLELRFYRARLPDSGDDERLRRLLSRGRAWSPVDRPVFPEGFGFLGDLLPEAELAESDFYREWMEPRGLAPEGPLVHTFAIEDGRAAATLAVCRRIGGRPLGEDDRRLGDLLASHLRRAWAIQVRSGGARHERLALGEVLDRLPVGVILIDPRCRPLPVNRAARHILAERDGFGFDDKGPRAAIDAETQALRRLVSEAVRGGLENGGFERAGVMAVSRPSGRRGYVMHAAPLLAAGPDSRLRDAVAVVVISDPDAVDVSPTEMLQSLFSLTPAEADLVRLLVQGHSLEEAAAARGVTLNTVRTQLKQVFAKTDTKRQGELVRLVLSGIATAPEADPDERPG